jgi:transposase
MENVNYFIGVDVSKSTLDVAVLKDGEFIEEVKIENQVVCIRTFLKGYIKEQGISCSQILVCMEHTGIYNYPILEVLLKMKIDVCVEPALQIKQSQGMTRGKNDTVDARRIAQYACKNHKELRLWKPQRAAIQKLRAMLTVRNRLIKAKIQLEVPLRESIGYMDPQLTKSLRASNKNALKGIAKDLKQVETLIHELVKADEKIIHLYKRATTVTGIGKITALNMIITTGEFELINESKKYACMVGVAPFEHSSGSSIRGRTRVSHLANMGMKRLLHLAAMAAIQSSGEMRDYYNRKVAQGKNKMSVINAVRNKLISRVFACVTKDRDYQKIYQNALA